MRLLELVEAIQQLREGRPVLRSFGTREANQAPQEVPRGRVLGPGRDAGQEPGPIRHVEDVSFFGKKRTFALGEALPARLRRAQRPGLACVVRVAARVRVVRARAVGVPSTLDHGVGLQLRDLRPFTHRGPADGRRGQGPRPVHQVHVTVVGKRELVVLEVVEEPAGRPVWKSTSVSGAFLGRGRAGSVER